MMQISAGIFIPAESVVVANIIRISPALKSFSTWVNVAAEASA